MKFNSKASSAGISLVEIVITIAVLGILSSMAVPAYHRVISGSSATVASNLVETLNGATKKFSHSQWDLIYTAKPTQASDELYVLRTLQWKDPDATGELNPHGPFMTPNWSPATSSSDEDYRAEWTGSMWRLLEPGESGTGLKLALDANDVGTGYTFPKDFKPAGAN